MINNNESASTILRIIEVIGQDELKSLDEDTLYFIITALNRLDIDYIRNKILLKLNKDREISKKIANEVTKIISGDTGFYTASQAIIDTFLDKNK